MRKLFAVMLFAAAFAGCGGDKEKPPASAPASAEVHAEEGESPHDLKGYSEGVKEYYGKPHSHGDIEDPNAAVEAEYHQPPVPPENGLRGTIALTATNIGVRLAVTVTRVDEVRATSGERYTAVHVKLDSTGIAIFESELTSATLSHGDGEPVPLDAEAKAKCSNGLDEPIRLDVGFKASGCLLFPKQERKPTRFQLSLEQVPVEAGGIWSLG